MSRLCSRCIFFLQNCILLTMIRNIWKFQWCFKFFLVRARYFLLKFHRTLVNISQTKTYMYSVLDTHDSLRLATDIQCCAILQNANGSFHRACYRYDLFINKLFYFMGVETKHFCKFIDC